MKHRPRAWQAVLVLAVLSPTLLGGCVSVDVSRLGSAEAGTETGSVQVVVVEKSGDKEPTKLKVVTRLVRLENGAAVPVAESTDSTWTKTDLPPGRYQLRASHWIDEQGQPRKFAKTDQDRFTLHAGEAVEARVVLESFPTGPVITIAGVVMVAILITELISALGHHGSGGSVLPPLNHSERVERDRRHGR